MLDSILALGSFLISLLLPLPRFGGTRSSSEQFNCAGRTIKTGLIAVDIVSHWTWAATLLQSSNVAWKYGVSGPFWCASYLLHDSSDFLCTQSDSTKSCPGGTFTCSNVSLVLSFAQGQDERVAACGSS